jgi:hypothetical protein
MYFVLTLVIFIYNDGNLFLFQGINRKDNPLTKFKIIYTVKTN